MADVESNPVRVTKRGEPHCLNYQTTCKFSDVDYSLGLPDPVIHRDVAPITDCLEMFKMANENEVHIRVGCLDQNAGESTVQSMDDVKDDPRVGLLRVAHCCHIFSRTDMTNSRSVAHSDVDISS